jgi:hypothetical protein
MRPLPALALLLLTTACVGTTKSDDSAGASWGDDQGNRILTRQAG